MSNQRKLHGNTVRKILKRVSPEHHEKLLPLLKRIIVEPEKGCWLLREDWSEYIAVHREPGHRYMFRIFHPESIVGYFVCHKCDRPGCINPDHLFRGTNSDNQKDAFNKGRKKTPNIKKVDLDKLIEQDRQRNLRYTLGELVHANRTRFT